MPGEAAVVDRPSAPAGTVPTATFDRSAACAVVAEGAAAAPASWLDPPPQADSASIPATATTPGRPRHRISNEFKYISAPDRHFPRHYIG